MADVKISQLVDGAPAQDGDQIPVNRSGSNYRITAGDIVDLVTDGLTVSKPVFTDANGDFTSTGTVPVNQGGTGATTASDARTNLGLGSIATQSASSVAITGGSIAGITDLALADGGTGASTAAGARTNLLPSYAGNATKVLKVNAGATDVEWAEQSASGVTSITAGTGLSGGTITSTGTIALATAYGDTVNPYAAKTANYVLAAPNGSSGEPTFRALVAADIPTLNQNTTGTAANVSGTVAIANGGTGATTESGARTALGVPASPTGTNAQLLANDGSNGFANVTVGSGLSLSSGTLTATGSGSGTVTSVGLTMPSGFTVASSPVTTSGTIAVTTSLSGILKGSGSGFTTATSGTDYAPATSGTSILKGSGTGGFSNATAGTDYLAPPSGTSLLKANSGGALANATAGTDYAAPTTGTNAQLLANNGSGGFSNVTVGSGLTYSAGTLSASGGSGTVTSVDVSGGTTGLTTSGGPVTSSGTITLAGTLAAANGGTGQTTYTNGQLLIGNASGGLSKATLTAGSNVTITNGDGAITIAASGGGSSVPVSDEGTQITAGVTSFNFTGSGVTATAAGNDVTVNIPANVVGPASATDNQIALFDSTTGKLIKAATTTGLIKASSGVIAAAVASTDYAPATTGTSAQLLANNGTGGFSNVTVGSNLTLSAGTLSATGGLAWQSVQTTGFTAVAGRAYPCNTTSAAFTVTLPASASAGDQILLTDYAGTWDTNFLTVNPNGLKIYGSTDNQIIPNERGAVTLVYVDTTQGWITSSGMTQSPFAAPPPTVELLVVAGAGGGGTSFGAGSGAGGYRASSSFSVSGSTSYALTVGAGGAKSTSAYSAGSQGSSSVFSSITSAGGGGGGSNGYYSGGAGGNGGSGGGGGGAPSDRPGTYLGGTGDTPSVSPAQGFNGGNGNAGSAGGSGGSGSAGGNCAGANSTGGSAGNGTSNSITGTATYYAAGVAGFGTPNGSAGSQGGIAYNGVGAVNSGSGAGADNNGPSGVVIIAYPSTYRNLASISAGLTYTLDTSTRSGYKVYKFTAGTGTVSW